MIYKFSGGSDYVLNSFVCEGGYEMGFHAQGVGSQNKGADKNRNRMGAKPRMLQVLSGKTMGFSQNLSRANGINRIRLISTLSGIVISYCYAFKTACFITSQEYFSQTKKTLTISDWPELKIQ